MSQFSYFYFQLEFCKECKEPFRRGHSCNQNQSNPTTAARPSVSICSLKTLGNFKMVRVTPPWCVVYEYWRKKKKCLNNVNAKQETSGHLTE